MANSGHRLSSASLHPADEPCPWVMRSTSSSTLQGVQLSSDLADELLVARDY